MSLVAIPLTTAQRRAASSAMASAAQAYPSTTIVGGITIYSTDVLLRNDKTLPDTTWASYFDTIARRYFYLQASTQTAQYEHPSPPVFNGTDNIVVDASVYCLPPGWVKLQQTVAPNLIYYLSVNTAELSWYHPNPPPDPATLTPVSNTTLFSTYLQYVDPRTPEVAPLTSGLSFYVNTATKEAQWNFPDAGFNPGPSSAQRASSAVAQRASSAQQQAASSANFQRVTAAMVSYRYILLTIFSPRVPPDTSDPYNTIVSDSAISGFFLNRTNVLTPWRPTATATAVDPNTLQPLVDADGNPITYTSGSQYGNLFDNSLTTQITPIQPSGTYPVSILIDNTVPIMFNAYYFGLGSSSNADIVQWSIKGSMDGVNFFMVDDRSAEPQLAVVPDQRNTFIPPIELGISYKQTASSAVRQTASSARAQGVSSARVQDASSAVAQTASSSVVINTASSAVAQTASSAIAQQESSAVRQTASAAAIESAIAIPVASVKTTLPTAGLDTSAIVAALKTVHSRKSTATQVAQAKTAYTAAKAAYAAKEAKLRASFGSILKIAPGYEDPALQTRVSDPAIEALGYTKLYDGMRRGYLIKDQNGDTIPYPITIDNRQTEAPVQEGGGEEEGGGGEENEEEEEEEEGVQQGGSSVLDQLRATDMPVSTTTIPAGSPWAMYYDSAVARYFYINVQTNAFTYDHPFPPVYALTDSLVNDASVFQLTDGWGKYMSPTLNIPYYYNYKTFEVLWNHPKPPKRNASFTPISDPTLDSSMFTEYMDPTANQLYYVNNTTFEAFWEFPDEAFLPGPSAAVKAAEASSAVAQTASSASIDAARAAVEAEARAAASRAAFIASLTNPAVKISLAAAKNLVTSVTASVNNMVAAGQTYPPIALLVDTIQALYNSTAYAESSFRTDEINLLIKTLENRLNDMENNNPDNNASAANAAAAEQKFKSDITSTDRATAQKALTSMVNSVIAHAKLIMSMGSFSDAIALLDDGSSQVEMSALFTSDDTIAIAQHKRLTDLKENMLKLDPSEKAAAPEPEEEVEEEAEPNVFGPAGTPASKVTSKVTGKVTGKVTPTPMAQPAYAQPNMAAPYGQMPYGQMPYGQMPYGQMPYMGMPMGMGMGMGMPMTMGSGQPTIVVVPTGGQTNGCCSKMNSCGCGSCSNSNSQSSDPRLLSATAQLDKSVNSLKESVINTSNKLDGITASGASSSYGSATAYGQKGGDLATGILSAGLGAGTAGLVPPDLTSVVTSLDGLTGAVKSMNDTVGTIPATLTAAKDNIKTEMDTSYSSALTKVVAASQKAAEDAVNGTKTPYGAPNSYGAQGGARTPKRKHSSKRISVRSR